MKSKSNKLLISKNIKATTLILALLIQFCSLPASAQEFGFDDHHATFNQQNRHVSQFEIGIRIPFNKLNGSSQILAESTRLYASYYLDSQSSQIGLGFSRNFGRNAQFEYASLYRNPAQNIDISLPFYESTVFNASSTGAGRGLSGTYLIGIGAGLLLLAAASGSGGEDEKASPATNTINFGAEAVKRFEETLSLPVCSPIPPADGNEQPCRVPL